MLFSAALNITCYDPSGVIEQGNSLSHQPDRAETTNSHRVLRVQNPLPLLQRRSIRSLTLVIRDDCTECSGGK